MLREINEIVLDELLSTISLPRKGTEKLHITSRIANTSASLESVTPTDLENMHKHNTSPLSSLSFLYFIF